MKKLNRCMVWLAVCAMLLLPCGALGENTTEVTMTNKLGDVYILDAETPSVEGLPGVTLDTGTNPSTLTITGTVECASPNAGFLAETPILLTSHLDPNDDDVYEYGDIVIRFADAQSSLLLHNASAGMQEMLLTGALTVSGGGTLTIINESTEGGSNAMTIGDLSVIEGSTFSCTAYGNEAVTAEGNILVSDGSTLIAHSGGNDDGWPALWAMNATVLNGSTLTIENDINMGIRLMDDETGDLGILTVENSTVSIKGGEYWGNINLEKLPLTGVQLKAYTDVEGTQGLQTDIVQLDAELGMYKNIQIAP